MKVSLECGEEYPVYYLGEASEFTRNIEVSDEFYRRWCRVANEFDEIQAQLAKLEQGEPC